MILDRIVQESKKRLAERRSAVVLEELKRLASEQAPALDFASALRGEHVRIIAEVKKTSPSKGVIRPDFKPVEIARVYADSGAAAISVLTEPAFFQGSLSILKDIRGEIRQSLPLLRKDFLFDRYQVYESRAYGADSLLLITAILSLGELIDLLGLSRSLGMEPLVEVHNETEVEAALDSGAGIIGINNRDLRTFTVDLSTTQRLRPLIPPDKIVVSESGIKDRADIEELRKWGVDAVLIGETLMSASDIAGKLKELL